MKTRRILATILTFAMLISLIPVTVSVSAAEPFVSDGIVFTKTAQANGDGTVDITMEAYTTGTVTNTQDSVPADIVLVLDTSGSMDDSTENVYHFDEVLGTTWTPLASPRYGFEGSTSNLYIKNAVGEFVALSFVDYDDSNWGVNIGHQYYTDGTNRYYPKLESGINTSGRTESYEEKQFYRRSLKSHMEVLKDGASAFIADVAAKNASITDPTKKHRISIVKFATADYCYINANGNVVATDSHDREGGLAVGDYKNSSNYNYTQVVKDLTVVDNAGKTELTTALNNLTSGGATAVDYGIQLAENVLGARAASEVIGRSEAVIIFTDGSPTHSSDYEVDVAGSAINEALALKNAGVKIFSIGGANNADSSVLGDDSNRFMHYISNNYPKASYNSETTAITPGDGSITNGFYMTPSDDKNLEEIFSDIFNQTANSDIVMGASAGVIDTISPYFTIPGADLDAQKTHITLEVAEKTVAGWNAPVAAGSEASVVLADNTVTVRGFSFDDNYVSTTPRSVGGVDFYGKKLIIKINGLTPDYDEIDLHHDALIGGAIPTNEGNAAVVDSQNQAVATKPSPSISAKAITYMLEGVEYKSFYRLPGSPIDLTQLPVPTPSKEGHNFNGWSRSDAFTMPDENVVITGDFTKQNYPVTYVYSGTVPAGASTLPNNGAPISVPYGTTVTVAPPASAPGYHFVGWTPRQQDLTITQVDPSDPTSDKQFTMPANNVTLIGYFMPGDDTAYKIEHYTETFTDGEFTLKETENKFGETDTAATAAPKTYTGFAFDPTVDGTVLTDNALNGDGTTVLKLYYTRNEYKVVYEFDGDVPSGVTAPATVTIKYGKSYTIEDAMSEAGYDFKGWYYTSDLTYANVSGDTIIVDRNIYLAGEFTAKDDTLYTVEHWIQNIDDDNYTRDDTLTEHLTGTTDTNATAYARILEGREFNATVTASNLPNSQMLDTTGLVASITANIDRNGNTVIRFYYDRIEYTVIYEYEGTVPTDAPDKTALTQTNIRYGATVTVDTTVPNGAMPIGYESFYGWYRGAAIDTNLVTEFTMPARNVELLGYFVPDDNTAYTVKHFMQNANGTYPTIDNPNYTETLYGETLQNVTALPLPTIIGMGYTYRDDLSTDDGQIAANGSLELLLYYDRISYNVTYQFINAPAGKVGDEPTDSTAYRHGETVLFDTTVQEVAGYTFHGWHIQDADITTATGGFIMPNRAVVIYGAWTANSNTSYTVEHYYENLKANPTDPTTYGDGNGAATPKYTETQHTGTTGHTAVAAEIPVAGFTLDTTIPGTIVSDTIAGNGSTTLKLYYKRNTYSVAYDYTGTMPNATFETNARALLPATQASVKYGATVVVASTSGQASFAALESYAFHGWTSNDTDVVFTTSGTDIVFTMPMEDVTLLGHFHPNSDTPYTINHYLELEAGGYPSVPNYTENRPGETNANASVYARKFDGFQFDETTTAPDVDTANGETLVHDGDYYIITKKISGTSTTVFNFYYKRISYAVEYKLDGTQPHGVTATIPADYNHVAKFGATVNVKADLAQEGYIFTGWYSDDPAIGADYTTFTMPSKPVVLKGKFTADTNTAYTVEYYQQKLDAAESNVIGADPTNSAHYELVEAVPKTGTTGHTATAEIKAYEGFVARTDNTISAIIAGDGSTVIRLYYDRITNPIKYHFYGTFVDHTIAELPATEDAVPYGAKRNVAANIICDLSHRHVPTEWASPHVAPAANGEFRMPATKVDFYTTVRHIYKVEYELEGGTGASGVAYTPFDVFAGTVIDVKSAPTKANYSFTGWKLDGTDTIYNSDDEITVNKDIKLIAQWTYSGGGGGGGGVTRYNLTYESNGGTEYKKETYNRNTTVKIDKTPEKDGYVFEGWYEDKELTKYVDEVKMTKNITVYAKWVEDNGGAGNGYDTPGSLNGEDHFAYVVGYPDGTVRPNDNISRAEVTSIFFRLLKPDEVRDKNLTDENDFADVNTTDWYNTAISTMAKLGIVNGRTLESFVPDAFITRAEFAAICARFDDSEFEIVDNFTDVQGHWAEHDVHEAAAHGWIRGYEDGTFKPDQFITRAEAMTMINRVLNRVPETANDLLADMINWPDNSDKSAWYYLAVQEATNSHDYEMKNHIYEKWTALREATDWTKYE